jgi:hypothetical protein
MLPEFYEKAGPRLSPGDILQTPLPFSRLPKPLSVVRKVPINLPQKLKAAIQGELREVFEVGKHVPNPGFRFESPGEEVLSHAKTSTAIFLTWGSEVDSDLKSKKLNKKDWLIAPLLPLAEIDAITVLDEKTGAQINLGQATREGRSPKYFPLQPLPGEPPPGYYVDFRKIFPLAATHFDGVTRHWQLGPMARNDFYSQLMWFFTRKRIFFSPVPCSKCGAPVDLGVTFDAQSFDPE